MRHLRRGLYDVPRQHPQLGPLANQNGEASMTKHLPNVTALAGVRFRHQVLAIQTGAGLAILSATASDAVVPTVGSI